MSSGTPCLPTPPGSEGDAAPETIKSTASYPDQQAAMTAAIAVHSQVGPAADQLAPASSFAGRRPQADSLPAVQMPSSREVGPGAVTYSSPYGVPATRGAINNILTPAGESSAPLSAGVHSVQQHASPYGYWPQSAPLHGAYPYSNMQSQYSSQQPTPSMASRPSYSPPSSLPSRSNLASPTNSEMPAPPGYDMNAARYQSTIGMSAPAVTASSPLPPMVAGSRAQNPYTQAQMTSTSALVSPTYAPYGVQNGSGYFGAVQTTQAQQYSSYGQYAPQTQSMGQTQRLSPTMPNSSQASLQRIYPAPTAYGSYNYNPRQALPSLDNPVMTNAHVPGGNLSMFGGPQAHSGVLNTNLLPPQGPASGPSYSAYGQPPPQNDKPFKCNECPQAFNRNHDLKRHQKIHLAIKPFPCTNCDKSFSRKDALKRHILVKGCGNKKRSSDSDPVIDFNSNSSNDRDADGETSA